MKFSVIIPTFQGKKYIERSIKSVLSQKNDLFEIEILVIDDCSLDNTYEYLKDLEKKYDLLKVFKEEKNGGPGFARNRGVIESTGDYIFFLDDDDIFASSLFIKIFYKLSESSYDVGFFDWEYDKKSTAKIYGYEGRDDLKNLNNDKINIIEEFLINKIDCSVIYSVFKREFLLKNNILFREGIHEDIDYMFEVLLKSESSFTLDEKLYIKNNRKDSIVNSFTENHVNGYFQSLLKIYKLLNDEKCYTKYRNQFMVGIVNVTSSRIMRIFNLEKNDEQKKKMFNKLSIELNNLLNEIDAINFSISKEDFKTKYEMIYEKFLSYKTDKYSEFIEYLDDIKDKFWSCFDLHNSIFFAPDEIRTCCKRYFHKNEFKGDVVILKGKNNNLFTYKNILDKKISLFKEINRNNAPECEGCPFLSFENWGKPLDKGIKYLSFEYHSVCNMRCSYCSDTYYGGKKPVYDILKTVKSLKSENKLKNIPYVVWGGGEPTIDSSFEEMLEILDNELETTKQRVITNGIKFIPSLKELLDKNKAYIVTSIDAGTDFTFKKVRGVSKLSTVLENLQKYSNDAPHNVIIKYLLIDENNTYEEIDSFIELIKDYRLENCNYQISYNFKKDIIDYDNLEKLIYLYCSLLKIGVEFLFLDDLVWQRLKEFSTDEYNKILTFLEKKYLSSFIVKKDEYSEVIIWGTGAQAKLIINKSFIFKNLNIKFFIDPRKEIIGGKFFNKNIESPDILNKTDSDIFIAAVQSAPLIYQQYKELGFDTKRIIKKLVL